MASSQKKTVGRAYLKVADECKQFAPAWPPGRDTDAETFLKQCYLQEGLSLRSIDMFRQLVYEYHAGHGRELPWRRTEDPWQVLVSEVMLQQTQVDRVIPKFNAFVERFPGPAALATAPLPDLLMAWQGLGYNRRALNLQRSAQMLIARWGCLLPEEPQELQQLPGIGPYTAGAIAAFAFNRPSVFLETNIRAVLLHLFCSDRHDITDRELLPLVEGTLDQCQPRLWYNALMDYGSDLKRRFPNPGRRSHHHSLQSRFEGSDRQVRGALLRLLLGEGGKTAGTLCDSLGVEKQRLQKILSGMVQEGFLVRRGLRYLIPPA